MDNFVKATYSKMGGREDGATDGGRCIQEATATGRFVNRPYERSRRMMPQRGAVQAGSYCNRDGRPVPYAACRKPEPLRGKLVYHLIHRRSDGPPSPEGKATLSVTASPCHHLLPSAAPLTLLTQCHPPEREARGLFR